MSSATSVLSFHEQSSVIVKNHSSPIVDVEVNVCIFEHDSEVLEDAPDEEDEEPAAEPEPEAEREPEPAAPEPEPKPEPVKEATPEPVKEPTPAPEEPTREKSTTTALKRKEEVQKPQRHWNLSGLICTHCTLALHALIEPSSGILSLHAINKTSLCMDLCTAALSLHMSSVVVRAIKSC